MLDVGGESTRPGAEPVPVDEELRRVLPGGRGPGRPTAGSRIDTRKPEVARAAVAAGATLINDVSAELWPVAAELGRRAGSPCTCRASPRTMQDEPRYDDVVAEVCAFLDERADPRRGRPVCAEIWVDPGHRVRQDASSTTWPCWPTSTGSSRWAGRCWSGPAARRPWGGSWPSPTGSTGLVPPDDRLAGSIATEVWAMHRGAAMVRAHDVRAAVQASKVVAA